MRLPRRSPDNQALLIGGILDLFILCRSTRLGVAFFPPSVGNVPMGFASDSGWPFVTLIVEFSLLHEGVLPSLMRTELPFFSVRHFSSSSFL